MTPGADGRGTVVTVLAEKGGVGKTTSAITLACALVELGQRVQIIGVDPQGDISGLFADSLAGDRLSFQEADAGTLARTIDRTADFTIVDCPPNLGPVVARALSLADIALVPVEPSALPLLGLQRTLETLAVARDPGRRGGNPRLAWRLLLNQYDTGDPDTRGFERELRDGLGASVLPGFVKATRAVRQASNRNQTILQTGPRTQAARAFRGLARQLVQGLPEVRQ